MIEIRFHGRGGQGAVMACDILASALLKEGKYGQSFPLFGGERRGAPVQAFLRADDKKVLLRGELYEPDHVVVLDEALIKISNVLQGLTKEGWVVINSPRKPEEFEFSREFRVATVDASSIAAKHGLGSPLARIGNTAILGAFARFSGIVSLESVIDSVAEFIPIKTEQNITAVRQSYDKVVLPG